MSAPVVAIFHHDRDTVSNLFLLQGIPPCSSGGSGSRVGGLRSPMGAMAFQGRVCDSLAGGLCRYRGESSFLLPAPFSLGQPRRAGGSSSRSSGSSSGFWSLAVHGTTGERRSASRPSTTSPRIRRILRALFLSHLYEKMPSIHPNTTGLKSPPNSEPLSEQSEESLSLLQLHNRVAPRNDNLPNRFVLGYL